MFFCGSCILLWFRVSYSPLSKSAFDSILFFANCRRAQCGQRQRFGFRGRDLPAEVQLHEGLLAQYD